MSFATLGSMTGCDARMGKPCGPGGKRDASAATVGVVPGRRPGGSRPGGRSDAPAEIHCWICGGSWMPPAAGVCGGARGRNEVLQAVDRHLRALHLVEGGRQRRRAARRRGQGDHDERDLREEGEAAGASHREASVADAA